ncbi:MAG: SGNH/GDSL hydrolase family protein [Clostridia bacterium]|nr:SGNH/GDSL hydrolase family protein [Clostridia bacterium]
MRILFQGDSITDCGRNRDNIKSLGGGYPRYVAELLRETYLDMKFEFINKGISAHQTKDLLARWQEDAVSLDPDIITILIGVNDTWHHISKGDFIPNELFESNYRKLLSDIKNKTKAKIVMLEQFVLDFPDMERFHPDIEEKIRIVRRLAREFADVFVPLDGIFASACVVQPPEYWTKEGVHPTEEGHRLIADYCYNAICDLIDINGLK